MSKSILDIGECNVKEFGTLEWEGGKRKWEFFWHELQGQSGEDYVEKKVITFISNVSQHELLIKFVNEIYWH